MIAYLASFLQKSVSNLALVFFLLRFQISGHVLENRRFAILGFRLRDIFDDPSKILTLFLMIKTGAAAVAQRFIKRLVVLRLWV